MTYTVLVETLNPTHSLTLSPTGTLMFYLLSCHQCLVSVERPTQWCLDWMSHPKPVNYESIAALCYSCSWYFCAVVANTDT